VWEFRKEAVLKQQPVSFAQREDAGKKKEEKRTVSRRIERSEIDCPKSRPKGVAGRRMQ